MIPGFFNKAHLIAYCQGIEAAIDQTIAMAVDISLICGYYPAEILVTSNRRDFSMGGTRMFFTLPRSFLTNSCNYLRADLKATKGNAYSH
ncbi:hypothetical protein [Psychromonas sp.]|uniref:hypothetical protein n=1 Tax=Psychromonas sp. TaxID=1884585 RepID=UPI0039E69933